MNFLNVLGSFILIQCLISECFCDVENRLTGEVLFSNQDVVEENREIVTRNKETILSRNEMFDFLKVYAATPKDAEDLKNLLDLLGPKELRHLDYLIYLMGYYKNSELSILRVIYEILTEREIEMKKMMQNFG